MKYRMPTMTNPKMIKKRVFLIDKLYHDEVKNLLW